MWRVTPRTLPASRKVTSKRSEGDSLGSQASRRGLPSCVAIEVKGLEAVAAYRSADSRHVLARLDVFQVIPGGSPSRSARLSSLR